MRKPIQHDLKCEHEYFKKVASGEKPWELRKNDRDYQIGDILLLRQLDKDKKTFTGLFVAKKVTYILTDAPQFGLMDGYCIMSII